MEKREPSYTVGGNTKWAAIMENSMEIPPKTKNRAIIWYSYPIWGYLFQEDKTLSWKDTWTPMFIAILFTVAKIEKLPNSPPQMTG